MKKQNHNERLKTIIILGIIIIFCLLAVFYRVNFDNLFEKANELFASEDELTKKEEASLEKCIDGDTVKLRVDNKTIKVRFLAINTPETVDPYSGVEEYGEEASEYTCNLLKSASKIQISYEKRLTNKDKYGRDLVWLWVDDELIQEKLIQEGYAEVKYIYAKYKYTENLLNLQNEVKEKKKGIWSEYEKETYKSETYSVIFKVNNFSHTVDVQNGQLVKIISNPTKRGYTFSGWMLNNRLYDLSDPITETIVLEPKYEK